MAFAFSLKLLLYFINMYKLFMMLAEAVFVSGEVADFWINDDQYPEK